MPNTDLLTFVRRSWRILLTGAVLAAIVGYVVASSLPKSYSTQVQLLVGPVNTDESLDASGALAGTYAQLATSRPVLQAAIDATHSHMSAHDLGEHVSVGSNSVTRIVTITVTDPSPRHAATLATALGTRLRSVANTLPASSTAELDDFSSQPEVAALSAAGQAQVLAAARRSFGTSAAGRLEIVDPADVPSKPSSPSSALISILALLCGLIVAGLFAAARDSWRGPRVDAGALEQMTPAFLGTVLASPPDRDGGRLPAESSSGSPAALGYEHLAARLALLHDGGGPGSLVVVDSCDGADAGAVAANLAAVVARSGRKVRLVDAGPDEAGVTRLLGLRGRPGYAELVAAPETALNGHLDDLCVSRRADMLVLPNGAVGQPASPSVDEVGRLLTRMGQGVELVIVSVPAPSRSSATMVWARAADATVFVADDAGTSTTDITRTVEDLTQINGRFHGTILGRHRPGGLRLTGLSEGLAGLAAMVPRERNRSA